MTHIKSRLTTLKDNHLVKLMKNNNHTFVTCYVHAIRPISKGRVIIERGREQVIVKREAILGEGPIAATNNGTFIKTLPYIAAALIN